MYHAIVRRRTARVFDRLRRGEWDAIVADLAPDVHHVFPGDHPLGGERHDRDAVRRWFERLGLLFPGHDFAVHRVVSRGGPRSTWVAVQWSAILTPAAGPAYTNHGAHWIHLRWGKCTAFHAYLDTQRIASACAEMVAGGVEEAGAPPVT
ncbi:MAG: nuclear transport factor 2 family protein [Solirubrobacteraceae bacterium]